MVLLEELSLDLSYCIVGTTLEHSIGTALANKTNLKIVNIDLSATQILTAVMQAFAQSLQSRSLQGLDIKFANNE